MPDPIDQTRFAEPDFAPGEEQRIRDHENAVAERQARVDHVIYRRCTEFDEHDFLALAKAALDQAIDLRTSPPSLIAASDAIDAAVADNRRMKEVDDA